MAWTELSFRLWLLICRVFKHITEHSKQKRGSLDRNKWVFFGLPVYVFFNARNKFTKPNKHLGSEYFTWKNWEKFHYYKQLVLSSCCCCSWHDMNVWGPKVNSLRKQIIRFFQLVAWTTSFSHAKSATTKQKYWKFMGSLLMIMIIMIIMNEWMNDRHLKKENKKEKKKPLCKVLVGSELFRSILLITILGLY